MLVVLGSNTVSYGPCMYGVECDCSICNCVGHNVDGERTVDMSDKTADQEDKGIADMHRDIDQ